MPHILFEGEKQGKSVYLYAYEKTDEESVIFDTVVEIAGKKQLLLRVRRPAHDEERHFFNLIDFAFYESSVYVIYSSYGYIYMDQYQPGKEPVFVREFPVGSFAIMSYANGGGIGIESDVKWIDSNLYFYLNIGQDVGPKGLEKLFRFDRRCVFNINFSETHAKKIKILRLNPSGTNWYEGYEKTGESYIPDPVKNKTQYKILSKFYKKPYEYWLLTGQEILGFPEESSMKYMSLEQYSLITLNEAGTLSSDQIQVAAESLKHVLVTYCKQKLSPSFRIIEYLYNKYNKIYFFYNDGSAKMQIAMYDIKECEWVIDKYEEKTELATGSSWQE